MKKQTGLGIVELLVALAIIGIAFAALAFSQVFSFRVTRDSQKVAVAKDIASKKMEEIRGHGYLVFKECPTPSTITPPFNCGVSNQSVTNQVGYSLSWAITSQPKNPGNLTQTITLSPPPLISATVTVTWTGGSYVLSSYMSCADAGENSNTSVTCADGSLR